MNNTLETSTETVIQKHKCTMCSACYNVCPSNAIEFIEDNDGFMYPSINKEKCTNCGLCRKKCPALNTKATETITQRTSKPIAWGGYINDEETRNISSSGGVFSILSKYVFDNHGYVVGAKFTGGGICEHVIVDNYNDIAPLRGSKYVQSNINDTFKKIKTILEQENKPVLFTGTPCQVAGLYQVLGKDYDNLITVDLLCHGCPSQKLFREWLNEISQGKEQEITDIKFRDKSLGWREASFSYNYKGMPFRMEFYQTPYGKAFGNNISIRTACTDCRFNRTPRQGDFTIGDFWGIEHIHKNLDDNKGISAILVNSKKAEKIMNKTKAQYKILKKVPLNAISNFNMVNYKTYPHVNRPYFFDKYSKGEHTSISELINQSLDHKNGIAILNYGYSKDNYGSVLTAYALQEKIRQYGYSPVNIKFWDNEFLNDMSNLEDFAHKYIKFTPPLYSREQLNQLNKYIKTYIAGPDTVWTDMGFLADYYNNLFNFADFSKNICSYAASFGSDKLIKIKRGVPDAIECNEQEIKEMKRLFKRFSLISVREKSAVDICAETFNTNAQLVLDAVFFLSKEEWKKIIPDKYNQNIKYENVKYILNEKCLPQNSQDYLKNIKNMKSLYTGDTYQDNFFREQGKEFKFKGPEIEEWLSSIMNSKLFYTDSFHGTCFALIFNIPFVAFPTRPLIYTRMESLLNIAGLSDRTAHSPEDIERIINTPIDWNKVNENIKKYLDISENFLEKILELHNSPTPKEREYSESLELLISKLSQDYKKEKFYFLGIPIIKKKERHCKPYIYFLGIPLIKIQKKGNNTYYRFLGIKIFSKKVY